MGRTTSLLLLAVIIGAFSATDAVTNCSFEQLVSYYDSAMEHADLTTRYQSTNNLNGDIVWGAARYLISLATMYEATGDTKYLDHAVLVCDALMQQERDHGPDTDGVQRRGWPAGSRYLFSRPLVFRDERGAPSLEVMAVNWGHNEQVDVSVVHDSDGSYNLLARFVAIGHTTRYNGLNQRNVVEKVNARARPDACLWVRRLGSRPPAPVSEVRLPGHQVCFEILHNPRILTGFLKFVIAVREHSAASIYQRKADEYLAFVLEFEPSLLRWYEEDAGGGLLRMDSKLPFFQAGLAAPNGATSNCGRFFLHLHRLTGEVAHRDIALQMARRILSSFYTEDGRIVIHYALGEHLAGWSSPGPSLWYPKFKGSKKVVDTSHFMPTMLFILDLYDYDYLTDTQYLNWLNRILKQTWHTEGFSYYIDGTGEADSETASYTAGYFILLPGLENATINGLQRWYIEKYTRTNRGYIFNGWANFVRVAQQRERTCD
ncbi:MAG: hypothetical protein K8R90_10380 [Candidatus Cloacimonetes bacterium]|nr:hypothetical protein [Candidatus Cloacimonadota bacterium]